MNNQTNEEEDYKPAERSLYAKMLDKFGYRARTTISVRYNYDCSGHYDMPPCKKRFGSKKQAANYFREIARKLEKEMLTDAALEKWLKENPHFEQAEPDVLRDTVNAMKIEIEKQVAKVIK